MMRNCIIALVMIILGAGCTTLPQPDFSPDPPYLKVITYNVNWGFVEPQNVVDFITKADADGITGWHTKTLLSLCTSAGPTPQVRLLVCEATLILCVRLIILSILIYGAVKPSCPPP